MLKNTSLKVVIVTIDTYFESVPLALSFAIIVAVPVDAEDESVMAVKVVTPETLMIPVPLFPCACWFTAGIEVMSQVISEKD